MARSLPNFGVPVLFLSLLLVSACDRTQAASSLTGPAPLAATASGNFDTEPSSVRPEIFHSASCAGGTAWGVRIGVRVHGNQDVILRGLQFSYVDRFAVQSIPDVMAIPNLSTPVSLSGIMPNASPVSVPGFAPLPSATLIPIPGSSPIQGVIVSSGGTRLFPYFARFGCGVPSGGVIVIIVDAGDRDGRFSISELRVRVD